MTNTQCGNDDNLDWCRNDFSHAEQGENKQMNVKLLAELARAWDAEIDAHGDRPDPAILLRAQLRNPPVTGTLVAIGIAHHTSIPVQTQIPPELLEFVHRTELVFSLLHVGEAMPVRVSSRGAGRDRWTATPARTNNYRIQATIVADHDGLRAEMENILTNGAQQFMARLRGGVPLPAAKTKGGQ